MGQIAPSPMSLARVKTVTSNVIAIDGPAGSGKSTVSPLVAEKVGLEHLDTGLMYRVIAYGCLDQQIETNDPAAIGRFADEIEFEAMGNGVVEYDGQSLTSELRTPEVSKLVSVVAANEDVRNEMVRRQRIWVQSRGGGVLDGRDIGTAVFPDAKLKIFLVADLDERAKRRSQDSAELVEAIAADIARRDKVDSERESMPLRKAPDALEIDTTGLAIDEVVAEIVEKWSRLNV